MGRALGWISGFVLVACIIMLAAPTVLMSMFKGPPAQHKFDYLIDLELSLVADGVPLTAREAVNCSVEEVGGGFVSYGSNPRRLQARPKPAPSPHVTLPDGSALVLRRIEPCKWTEPPQPGTATSFVLYRWGGDLPDELQGTPSLPGRINWLDDLNSPTVIRLTDPIGIEYLSGGRISQLALKVIARADGEESPTPSPSAYQQAEGIISEDRERLRAFSARLIEFERPADAACEESLSVPEGSNGWIVLARVDRCRAATTREVLVRMGPNIMPATIDLDAEPYGSSPAFSIATLKNSGRHYDVEGLTALSNGRLTWTHEICIEDQCTRVPLTSSRDQQIRFYHPTTGRMVYFHNKSDSLLRPEQ